MRKGQRIAAVLLGVIWMTATGLALSALPEPLVWGVPLLVQDPRLIRCYEQTSTKTAALPQPESPSPTVTPPPTLAPVAFPSPQPQATAPPTPDGALPIEAQTLGQGRGTGYITLAAGSIKNSTDHPDTVLADAARAALPFEVEVNSPDPQVLILHTHATECYQPHDGLWYDPNFAARTTDTTRNMCAVGAAMTEVLNAAGIHTLHDQTLHDSPSYTESYARSARTARTYLEQYPSIKVILDVHRDAIERNGTRIKPVFTLDGAPAAQVMLIAGCDNGTTVRLPNWKQNLAFAAAWESVMEARTPGLTRPVLCGYRFYNQDVTTGSLLIEIGGHANTLDEALCAGRAAAQALAVLLKGEG